MFCTLFQTTIQYNPNNMKTVLKTLGILAALFSFASIASAHGAFEEIMKKGFKGSKEQPPLLKKVLDGSATAEEKTKLGDYLKKLSTLKPEKGDAASWKEKNDAILAAWNKNDINALKEATNCKACHKVHK